MVVGIILRRPRPSILHSPVDEVFCMYFRAAACLGGGLVLCGEMMFGETAFIGPLGFRIKYEDAFMDMRFPETFLEKIYIPAFF